MPAIKTEIFNEAKKETLGTHRLEKSQLEIREREQREQRERAKNSKETAVLYVNHLATYLMPLIREAMKNGLEISTAKEVAKYRNPHITTLEGPLSGELHLEGIERVFENVVCLELTFSNSATDKTLVVNFVPSGGIQPHQQDFYREGEWTMASQAECFTHLEKRLKHYFKEYLVDIGYPAVASGVEAFQKSK